MSALPEFMGGTHPGKDTYTLLHEAIAATKAAAAAPASAPAPRSEPPLTPASDSGGRQGIVTGGGGGGGGAAAAAAGGGVNPFYPTPLGTML